MAPIFSSPSTRCDRRKAGAAAPRSGSPSRRGRSTAARSACPLPASLVTAKPGLAPWGPRSMPATSRTARARSAAWRSQQRHQPPTAAARICPLLDARHDLRCLSFRRRSPRHDQGATRQWTNPYSNWLIGQNAWTDGLWVSAFGAIPGVVRIPLHRIAAHGGLGIVLAHQNRGSAPCTARPSPGVEKCRIRIDDPGRVRRTGARGTGAAYELSRRQKDQAFRRAVTTRRETADGDRPGFAAGTQAGEGPKVAPGRRQVRIRAPRRRCRRTGQLCRRPASSHPHATTHNPLKPLNAQLFAGQILTAARC